MHFTTLYGILLCLLIDRAYSFGIGSTLYCYRCISTHPGCGHNFAWLWHWSQACPEADDTCVKLIEKKGATEVITRDCLSSMKGVRTDIPADHYEGCKPASVDLKLGHYVNNSIKELDIKMNYYDETTFCLCRFDNRCNGGVTSHPNTILLSLVTFSLSLSLLYRLVS
ncbi:hypothetical protein GE061_009500 [Apolygus lucorum]|uniref:Uncharacterized protein n=1 Tax=Apolygus lucorum TaxID=248454 RepID=A0A6A4ITQ4_APOLU|nr:hypothetical protein GE061_009500 [Apolygus lucorum]